MSKPKNFAEFLQSYSKQNLIWALLDAFREGQLSKRSSIVADYMKENGVRLESTDKHFPLEELFHEFDKMAIIESEDGGIRQIALPTGIDGFEFMMRDFMSPKEKITTTVPYKPTLPTSYLAIRKPFSFYHSGSRPTETKPPEPEKPLSELDKAMMAQVDEPVVHSYGGDHPSHWGGGRRGNHAMENMSAEEFNEHFGGNEFYGGV